MTDNPRVQARLTPAQTDELAELLAARLDALGVYAAKDRAVAMVAVGGALAKRDGLGSKDLVTLAAEAFLRR